MPRAKNTRHVTPTGTDLHSAKALLYVSRRVCVCVCVCSVPPGCEGARSQRPQI